MEMLKLLFDYYTRVARLYPAMLTIAPLVLTVGLAAPSVVQTGSQSAAIIVVVLALLYFMASFARSSGKVVEPRLLKLWGGWPSTIILRHSDNVIDGTTKRRYHGVLQALCPDLRISDSSAEIANPTGADEVYRSATKKLIELRRGPKWNLLLQENASYGFRRNLFGMKALGIGLALALAFLTLFYWWFEGSAPRQFGAVLALIEVWPSPIVVAIVDLIAVVIWVLVVIPAWVRDASYDYALALFRTLDTA